MHFQCILLKYINIICIIICTKIMASEFEFCKDDPNVHDYLYKTNRKTCPIVSIEMLQPLPQSTNYRFVWIPGKLDTAKYNKSNPSNIDTSVLQNKKSPFHLYKNTRMIYSKNQGNFSIKLTESNKKTEKLMNNNKSHTVVNKTIDKLSQKKESNNSTDFKQINCTDQLKMKNYELENKDNSEDDTKLSDDHLVKNNTETTNTFTTTSSLHDMNYEILNTSAETNDNFEISILKNQQLEIKNICI